MSTTIAGNITAKENKSANIIIMINKIYHLHIKYTYSHIYIIIIIINK